MQAAHVLAASFPTDAWAGAWRWVKRDAVGTLQGSGRGDGKPRDLNGFQAYFRDGSKSLFPGYVS
jgi:hypothetical protein